MKFYVYVAKAGDRKDLEFVPAEHVDAFANSVFDPTTMEFTGIMVSADSPDEAKGVYFNPDCGYGEYVFSDEPISTASIRALANAKLTIKKSFEDMTERLNHMRIVMKMRLVAVKLSEVNELLNQVARDIHQNVDNPSHLTAEEVFERISKPSIEKTIKFHGESEKA